MPECDAEYLISYLFEIGPTLPAGMGAGPITQGEIQAFQLNSGIVLSPWEARFVRRLSIEYLGESQRAKEPGCPPPWKEAPYAQSYVAKSLQDEMRALARL